MYTKIKQHKYNNTKIQNIYIKYIHKKYTNRQKYFKKYLKLPKHTENKKYNNKKQIKMPATCTKIHQYTENIYKNTKNQNIKNKQNT